MIFKTGIFSVTKQMLAIEHRTNKKAIEKDNWMSGQDPRKSIPCISQIGARQSKHLVVHILIEVDVISGLFLQHKNGSSMGS